MGIENSALHFLLSSRKTGVSFARTITLGRQDLLLRPPQFKALLHQYGHCATDEEVERILKEANQFADPLFRVLGAQVIDSMDYSSFESATVVHDMNQPIPEGLGQRYSLVFDGGTLEHVFNFPQAIQNCMKMVEVGGHFLTVTPCNNMMGHGFYQFSPETFYRVFCEDNGFQVEKMYINEGWGSGPWLQVADPDKIQRRVGCVTGAVTNLYVRARKTRDVQIFSAMPYQSDYSTIWNNQPSRDGGTHRLDFFNKIPAPRPSLLEAMGRFLPEPLRSHLRMYRQYRRMLLDIDPEMFQEIKPD
ncbi:MAG: methyltransferase family protein [Gallionellaceae bacterium]|nr:MAG: methyltransferase family protein [Gallionellaceae bacterium]